MNPLSLNPWLLAGAAALAAAGFGAGWQVNGWRINAAWSAEKLAAEQQAENNRLLAQAAVNKAGSAHAKKAAKERVIVQTRIVEVEKYVPSSLPMLPGDFRLYHDAAAAGQEIDDSKRADAAPVAPKDVAVTLAENYAEARYDQGRLTALQEIVRASGCFAE
jgi:hypothetical protein